MTTVRHRGITARKVVATQGEGVVVSTYLARLIAARLDRNGKERTTTDAETSPVFRCRSESWHDGPSTVTD